MKPWKDAVAIVTGGASGIGRALCLGLGERGAIVVVADIDADAAAEVARAIAAAGGRGSSRAVDVRDAAAVQRLVDEAVDEHGRIDFLFNNAGIGILGEQRDVTLDDWRRVLDVNLNGVVHGVVAAYPTMVRQGRGHIVNTASLAGLIPAALELSYTASKYAVVGLSQGLRAEGARLGVRVSVVCPGFIDTPILQQSEIRSPVERAPLMKMIPTPMPPEKCARAILKGVAQNRSTIVVTAHAKLLYALHRLSPALVERLWIGVIDRFRAERRS